MDTEFVTSYGARVTFENIADMLSAYSEFQDYEIGQDNEGQLIIYTGLYPKNHTPKEIPHSA